MAQRLGLAIVLLGLSEILGCARAPGGIDTKVEPGPESINAYARGAVEVGRIKISQMSDFEASVERMSPGQRTELWRTLEQLHDRVHPSAAVEHDATSRAELSVPLEDDSGCTRAACSHSDPSCTVAQWCCAFGENALFYAYDEDIE